MAKWEDYKKKMNEYSTNAKADLASIEQSTNKYMTNYLNRLGLQGSGAGQSVMVQNANTMASRVNDVNANVQNNLDTYWNNLQQENMNNLNNMIASGQYDSIGMQNYIDSLRNSGDIDDNTARDMQTQLVMNGVNWRTEKDSYLSRIDEAISNSQSKSFRDELVEIRQKLSNTNISEQEYRDIVSNSKALNTNLTDYDEERLIDDWLQSNPYMKNVDMKKNEGVRFTIKDRNGKNVVLEVHNGKFIIAR